MLLQHHYLPAYPPVLILQASLCITVPYRSFQIFDAKIYTIYFDLLN
jgi:hypothetical protein